MHSDVRKFIREKRRAGWQVEDLANCHTRLHHPAGIGSVVISSSPSCHRWQKNTERDIRRLERGGFAPRAGNTAELRHG